MYAFIDLSADPDPARLRVVPTLGVEVTDPALAAGCALGNIDPQHGVNADPDAPCAALAAVAHNLPPVGTALATLRPDLDSVAAMAVLTLRAEGEALTPAMHRRLEAVDQLDGFRMGPWPGPAVLPRCRKDLTFGEGGGDLRVLTAAAGDRSLPLEARVALIAEWLRAGTPPPDHEAAAEVRCERLLSSLRLGATRVEARADGRIAVVVSLEPGALALGYRLAPVVIALNPAFRFPNDKTGPKFTIARFAPEHANLDAAVAAIEHLEQGWGGQAGIKGSPQNGGSQLALDQVVEIVAKSLC